MASGTFKSSTYTGAGAGFHRYIEVEWNSFQDTTDNTSTINWEAYSRSPSSDSHYVMGKNIVVTINGIATTVVGYTSKALYHNTYLGGGSITVTHDSNGKKSVDVSITAQIYVYGATNSSYTGSITMTPNPVYTLSISAGSGSSITVNRTSCPVSGNTGTLSAGTNKLYYDDKLKITFASRSNYSITTHTVNSKSFTSGNTHTVSGDVSIVARATQSKSTIGATDADIGSSTTITIAKHSSLYKHTLTYEFGDLTGTIATKTSDTSIAWTVPTTFYAEIPNNSSGTCTITCKTYYSDILLGSDTCTFKVTVDKNSNKPAILGTVVDINSATIALTGDSSKLIKNKSVALCTLTATPKNSATISSAEIAGSSVNGTTESSGVFTATNTYANVSSTSFEFYAKDSRGYDNSITVSPEVINYITLTCNPSVYRDTSTGNTLFMDVSGNFYRGSFGAYTNTLVVKYRYKKTGGSYPSTAQILEDGSSTDANGWITISDTLITKGISSYHSTDKLTLLSYPETDSNGEAVYLGFDYHLNYEVQIKVCDGANNYVLSTVTKTLDVPKGVPIYDWSENDFNFNVPIMLNNVNILNIMYPVGAVYMHSGSTLPTAINNIGSWSSVSTGISGIYAWKRTA